jgi:hypothetical protein
MVEEVLEAELDSESVVFGESDSRSNATRQYFNLGFECTGLSEESDEFPILKMEITQDKFANRLRTKQEQLDFKRKFLDPIKNKTSSEANFSYTMTRVGQNPDLEPLRHLDVKLETVLENGGFVYYVFKDRK